MRRDDLDQVIALGDAIHQAYPEVPEVARERFDLFPAGCLTLADEGEIAGYVVSHPWVFGDTPPLNSFLVGLPASADIYYLHDIVVAPHHRIKNLGVEGVRIVKRIAEKRRFRRIGLVAVNNSTQFWIANGFEVTPVPGLADKLTSYDDAACYMTCAIS